MDIIYKLTNKNKKEGNRFYIGSKKECQLIDIENIPTIVSLKTATPYYGSSSSVEFISDFKNGNIFHAEILEKVVGQDIVERETYYIKKYNAVESDEYYNMSLPLPYTYNKNAIGNIYGETINEIANSRSRYSKRRQSCKDLGFKSISDLCETIWDLKINHNFTNDNLVEKYGKNRHFYERIYRTYNIEEFLSQKNSLTKKSKKDLILKVREMISKNSSYENISSTLNINFLLMDYISEDWDLKPKQFHNATIRNMTQEELSKAITKRVLDGESPTQAGAFFKLDSTTSNRYFLKYIRDNLILNED